MKTMQRFAVSSAFVAALVLGLGGCAGMSTQDKNTAIGAGVGDRKSTRLNSSH